MPINPNATPTTPSVQLEVTAYLNQVAAPAGRDRETRGEALQTLVDQAGGGGLTVDQIAPSIDARYGKGTAASLEGDNETLPVHFLADLKQRGVSFTTADHSARELIEAGVHDALAARIAAQPERIRPGDPLAFRLDATARSFGKGPASDVVSGIAWHVVAPAEDAVRKTLASEPVFRLRSFAAGILGDSAAPPAPYRDLEQLRQTGDTVRSIGMTAGATIFPEAAVPMAAADGALRERSRGGDPGAMTQSAVTSGVLAYLAPKLVGAAARGTANFVQKGSSADAGFVNLGVTANIAKPPSNFASFPSAFDAPATPTSAQVLQFWKGRAPADLTMSLGGSPSGLPSPEIDPNRLLPPGDLHAFIDGKPSQLTPDLEGRLRDTFQNAGIPIEQATYTAKLTSFKPYANYEKASAEAVDATVASLQRNESAGRVPNLKNVFDDLGAYRTKFQYDVTRPAEPQAWSWNPSLFGMPRNEPQLRVSQSTNHPESVVQIADDLDPRNVRNSKLLRPRTSDYIDRAVHNATVNGTTQTGPDGVMTTEFRNSLDLADRSIPLSKTTAEFRPTGQTDLIGNPTYELSRLELQRPPARVIDRVYQDAQPYFERALRTTPLTSSGHAIPAAERDFLRDVAHVAYRLGEVMPTVRGTASQVDWLVAAMLKSKGYTYQGTAPGIGLDLEAMTTAAKGGQYIDNFQHMIRFARPDGTRNY